MIIYVWITLQTHPSMALCLKINLYNEPLTIEKRCEIIHSTYFSTRISPSSTCSLIFASLSSSSYSYHQEQHPSNTAKQNSIPIYISCHSLYEKTEQNKLKDIPTWTNTQEMSESILVRGLISQKLPQSNCFLRLSVTFQLKFSQSPDWI